MWKRSCGIEGAFGVPMGVAESSAPTVRKDTMRPQIHGAFPVGRILSLPMVAALAIHLFSMAALAAETESAGRKVQQEAGLNRSGFAYPVSTANRRFIDQTGKIYLL